MSFPKWDDKDPDDVLDYEIDWSTWLTASGGDTISSSTWTVPTGITKTTDSHTTTTTTIWLSGGTAGTTYTLTNEIVTAGGRTKDQSVRVKVKDE